MWGLGVCKLHDELDGNMCRVVKALICNVDGTQEGGSEAMERVCVETSRRSMRESVLCVLASSEVVGQQGSGFWGGQRQARRL